MRLKKLQEPKRGEFWVYKNYEAGVKGSIVELGNEVLEVIQMGWHTVEGKASSTDGSFIYIDQIRLIKKVTPEEHPEFWL